MDNSDANGRMGADDHRSLPPSPSHSTWLRTNGESVQKVVAAQRPRYEDKSWGKWLAQYSFHHANAEYAFEVVVPKA